MRFVGIDVGAETIKLVELIEEGRGLVWTRRQIVAHDKEPRARLVQALGDWDWGDVDGAAVSGRSSRMVNLPRVPTKQAQARGHRFLRGEEPATIVSIGSHGFSVLELRGGGVEIFRENGRCSQGTGNFLRQLVERFDLSIEQASELSVDVADPAPLSGRCPVILKTDMTHLANKGEGRARILAGLFDAVAQNVQVLIKPRVSPARVALAGGVTRARRIVDNFRSFVERHQMQLLAYDGDDALYIEALGSALTAAERPAWVPRLDDLLVEPREAHLDRVPALGDSLSLVTRMPSRPPAHANGGPRALVVGFDIGSTGSKALALDAQTREVLWQGYVRTNGSPVGAAQTLMRQFADGPAGRYDLVAVGATGSGREIVGSLMATCYGGDSVFVLNEIAAHAEGALFYDPRVDTIFEIGGQDAKYIRLADGRVVDAAMNEACSAGTGSFIEEQGKKFAGVADVAQLGREALCSGSGVSLGQHCSVFMAEIIDEAVAAGVEQRAIIAGIYDSIVQNYLNRVKGARSVGQVVFCQGMPFAADALAAAVARQTGSHVVVPPDPGTVGALGIALLTRKEVAVAGRPGLDPRRFLDAKLERKDVFVCESTQGCGGAGNKCRIDRLLTTVEGRRQKFTWGGGCSLWDRGTRKKKLPDRAPDPFRERQELTQALIERLTETTAPRGGKTIALTDEFQLKGLLAFFATYFAEMGLNPVVRTGAGHAALKRGIEEANVPFCAPMQQFHGLVSAIVEERPDYLFLPMLRGVPRTGDEPHATLCPIVQASGDLVRLDVERALSSRVLSPVIDVGKGGLESGEFRDACARLAAELGVPDADGRRAYRMALDAQREFDARCLEFGRRAIEFCRETDTLAVVVLGRAYTIHNTVLNSNVPAILREQGAIGIPVDCYPIEDDVPTFGDVFWGYAQRNLRAAHQVRRSPGLYTLYCSNYSCGPDSFNLHFYGYVMEGKPFLVIETDGHSGDAGTKTRVEAFLYCVREDLANAAAHRVRKPAHALSAIEADKENLAGIRQRSERVLIPRMGPGAEALAAALRGAGIAAESLPMPTRETVRIGRRHTSGKECVPMTITLGSLLERIEPERDTLEKFAFFMPSANGPCRFGVYNLLHKIVLERLGWSERVRIWSPNSAGYFDGIDPGFVILVWSAFVATDVLLEALYHVRPVESRRGASNAIYRRAHEEILARVERAAAGDLSAGRALAEAATGRLFGLTEIVERAAVELLAVRTDKTVPTVLLVGEIYVRCDPFANDFVVDKLEQRGIRCRFAPFHEWIEYMEIVGRKERANGGLSGWLHDFVQGRVQRTIHGAAASVLGWPERTRVEDALGAAASYVREELLGEAVLTVGGAVHEHREGVIDGVVSVGPLECMPNKIAEAQFFHAAEREGLLSLTLSVNGDPVDPEILDGFAFDLFARCRERERMPVAERASLADRSRALVERLWRRTAGLSLPGLPGLSGRRRLPVLSEPPAVGIPASCAAPVPYVRRPTASSDSASGGSA